MYFPLCLVVALLWLWLAGGALYGYRKRAYGALLMLGSIGLVTVAAVAVLLTAGPYYGVIYDTVLQPG